MREVGALEAQDTLGSLLDEVESGEEIVIMRRGRPVARLVREQGFVDREKAQRAAADIGAASVGVTLGGISLDELIDGSRP